MVVLLWDSSSLAKRYIVEVGSDTVNALFGHVPLEQMATAILAFVETYSVIRRHRNSGVISDGTFQAARSTLRSEVLEDPDFTILALEYDDYLAAIDLVLAYNVNSSDAAMLSALLRYARAAYIVGTTCVLVASDHRLLAAAQAEGLVTLNPESVSAAAIPVLLASLA